MLGTASMPNMHAWVDVAEGWDFGIMRPLEKIVPEYKRHYLQRDLPELDEYATNRIDDLGLTAIRSGIETADKRACGR